MDDLMLGISGTSWETGKGNNGQRWGRRAVALVIAFVTL